MFSFWGGKLGILGGKLLPLKYPRYSVEPCLGYARGWMLKFQIDWRIHVTDELLHNKPFLDW